MPTWKKEENLNAVCSLEGSNLREAIAKLNESNFLIVLVVTPEGKLKGTVTDGDIRRGLLRGLNLESDIELVMNSSFFSTTEAKANPDIYKIMSRHKINQLPILDQEGRVVGVHLSDKIKSLFRRDNSFVIMAGGKGTRLSHLTRDCPKPMLKIGNKPILQHIIEKAIDEGFNNFYVSINYLGNQIEDYFGNGEQFGVSINYLRETSPLGTAGSLSHLEISSNLPIVVTNGDVLTEVSYAQMIDYHSESGGAATLATRIHQWQNPFGVVETDGFKVVSFAEKPIVESNTIAGIYVMESQIVARIPKEEPIDMPNFLNQLRVAGEKIFAYPLHEKWLDVGHPEDLATARLNAKASSDNRNTETGEKRND
jgi:dTDP-glucose pyrophosphorylase/CBS domain-containing protein